MSIFRKINPIIVCFSIFFTVTTIYQGIDFHFDKWALSYFIIVFPIYLCFIIGTRECKELDNISNDAKQEYIEAKSALFFIYTIFLWMNICLLHNRQEIIWGILSIVYIINILFFNSINIRWIMKYTKHHNIEL